ncbi:hypothetical protein HDU96_010958 [Phlyctochytrium bullatum]|nr:hypothetical protein HDU96_010958 [Phlyctochytrium bullatum]
MPSRNPGAIRESRPRTRWTESQIYTLFKLLERHVPKGVSVTSAWVPWKSITKTVNASSQTSFSWKQVKFKVVNALVRWRQLRQKLKTDGAVALPAYWKHMNQAYERSGFDPNYVYRPQKRSLKISKDESYRELKRKDDDSSDDAEVNEDSTSDESEADEDSTSDESEADEASSSDESEVDEDSLSGELEAEVHEDSSSDEREVYEDSSSDEAEERRDGESMHMDDSDPAAEVECEVGGVASEGELAAKAKLPAPVPEPCNGAADDTRARRADPAWLRFLPGHGMSFALNASASKAVEARIDIGLRSSENNTSQTHATTPPALVDTSSTIDSSAHSVLFVYSTCTPLSVAVALAENNTSETTVLNAPAVVAAAGDIMDMDGDHPTTPPASADTTSTTGSSALSVLAIGMYSPPPSAAVAESNAPDQMEDMSSTCLELVEQEAQKETEKGQHGNGMRQDEAMTWNFNDFNTRTQGAQARCDVESAAVQRNSIFDPCVVSAVASPIPIAPNPEPDTPIAASLSDNTQTDSKPRPPSQGVFPQPRSRRNTTRRPWRLPQKKFSYSDELNAQILDFGDARARNKRLTWAEFAEQLRKTHGYPFGDVTLRKRFELLRHMRTRIAQGTVTAAAESQQAQWTDAVYQRVLEFGDKKRNDDRSLRWDQLADELYREHGLLRNGDTVRGKYKRLCLFRAQSRAF